MGDSSAVQQDCIVHVLTPSVMSLTTSHHKRYLILRIFESFLLELTNEFNDRQSEIFSAHQVEATDQSTCLLSTIE